MIESLTINMIESCFFRDEEIEPCVLDPITIRAGGAGTQERRIVDRMLIEGSLHTIGFVAQETTLDIESLRVPVAVRIIHQILCS